MTVAQSTLILFALWSACLYIGQTIEHETPSEGFIFAWAGGAIRLAQLACAWFALSAIVSIVKAVG